MQWVENPANADVVPLRRLLAPALEQSNVQAQARKPGRKQHTEGLNRRGEYIVQGRAQHVWSGLASVVWRCA